MLSRRQFLGSLAHTAAAASGSGLVVTFLVTEIGCASGSNMGTSISPALPCDGAGGESSLADGHTHTICIPLSSLISPPGDGATYTTSENQGHTHQLVLEQVQLQALGAGQTATLTTTLEQGHTHTFVLERATNAAVPTGNPAITPY